MERPFSTKYIILLLMLLFIICSVVTETGSVENFDEFYNRFKSDSVFQLERIKFPLKGVQIDNEDVDINGDTNKVWVKKNWAYIRDISNAEGVVFEKHVSNDTITMIYKGDDFGFYFEERFITNDGKWYLIYLIDKFI